MIGFIQTMVARPVARTPDFLSLPPARPGRTPVRIGAALAVLLAGLTARAEVSFGPPQIQLAGRPAPAPSAAVCGLVLVAQDSGPQVLFTERPAWAALALDRGETVQIAIPIRGVPAEARLDAEVAALEAGWADVSLAVGDAPPVTSRMAGGTSSLSAAIPAGTTNLVARLSVTAGEQAAAVLIRQVRLVAKGQPAAISLWPGSGNVNQCPPRVLPGLRQPLERFLIEWDWRMQDGIGTERAPVSLAEASRRVLQKGQALIQDLEARGWHQQVPRDRWLALQDEFRRLGAAPETTDAQWEEFWKAAHQVCRDIALSNPSFSGRHLAFVKQVPSVFSHQLTQYYGSCARPGGGIYRLGEPGRSMATRELAGAGLPQGSFQHLDVSPDGRRLLFAFCPAPSNPRNREEHLDRFYHVYEMQADGSGLRQLTSGAFDDFSPRYLPGGGLVFLSTRRGGFHRCGRGPCAVYTLCTAEGDGTNIRVISWHETQEWDPAVLPDGRIIYTRWDYVDRHAVHYQQLWSARPDGSGVRIFYGNNTFNPVGVWEARPVPGSHQIMATAGAHHAMTAGSIILVDPAREPDGPAPITRLTPDALFPESEAPVAMEPKGAWSAPVGLNGPPVVPPEAARWPGHCYRSPLPLSEKYFLAAYSYDPLIGEPTWNRANMFGLYLVDAFGNKELLYRDLNISSLWPMLLERRTEATTIASALAGGQEKEGTFFLQDVHTSWPSLPAERITRLRVLQVLPKSTPHANTPPVGLANASPGRQVLGTIPVEPDGSALFRAPAGIPLAFQALDEQGRAVQVMRSLVYLQPGETASCVGCHEHRTTAPPHRERPAALGRAPSAIAPGPEGSNPLSYPRLVQPVLDRHCVRCHKAGEAGGSVVLTGEPQGQYTVSYNALAPKVAYSAWGSKPGDFRKVNSEPLSQPDFFGARGTPCYKTFLPGHYQVALSRDELDRVITWMDANALFYGTFAPEDQARQLRGEQIAGPAIQ